MIPVNEIFQTLQGEAHWTGTPSLFIRLQGCRIGCPWCDTKYTWENRLDQIVRSDIMLLKQKDSSTYAKMSVDELMETISGFQSRHIVLTGGEPAQYDLTELTKRITDSGKSVQIETSGTYDVKVNHLTWVTVSPKVNMPGGFKVLPESIKLADEIKMPVGKMVDIETLQQVLGMRYDNDYEVWLQPLSQSRKATDLCIEQARRYGWRVSLQTHKFSGLR